MAAGTSAFYFLLAGILVLVAIVCLRKGLFADAARDRKRCPKCWYDMSGAGRLVCSECGHDARSEGRLLRTRRHWGWTVIGVLVLLLAAVGGSLPVMSWSEMAKHLPTTALVLMMPDLPATNYDAYLALCDRAKDDELWVWQWKLLAIRFQTPQQPLWEWNVDVADDWPASQPLFGNAEFTVWSADELWMKHSVLRAKVTPQFGDDREPFYARPDELAPLQNAIQALGPRSPDFLKSRKAGDTPTPTTTLSYRVEVQRLFHDEERQGYFESLYDDRCWRTISRWESSVTLDVTGTLDDRLALHDDAAITRAIRASVRLEVSNDRLLVREMFQPPRPAGMSCPIELELRRDGEVITTWLGWLFWSPRTSRHHFTIPGSVQGDRRPFGKDEDDGHEWSVLVRGTPTRALLDDDATAAWSGEFEMPLYLHRTEESLRYRSWQVESPESVPPD